MEDNLTIRRAISELSVLIPLYGKISVDIRMMKGDVPLIYQSMNANEVSNLEQIAENEQPLDAEDRILRERELKLKKGIFFTYQVLTIAYSTHLIATHLF